MIKLQGWILSAAAAALASGLVATANAQTVKPRYFFEADTVRGVPDTGPTGAPCVLNSQFKHKEEIVWRVRVLDAKSGKPVDDKGLKSLTVELADGQKIAMHYGDHPNRGPKTDHFWSIGWTIPESYPTGSFGYKVVATDKQGHSTEWTPFKVAPSQLTVVADAK
jgi:hypothetical protein